MATIKADFKIPPSSIAVIDRFVLERSAHCRPFKFRTEQVSQMLNVPLRLLKHWIEQGLIVPGAQLATGKGTQRLFSVVNLVEITLLARLHAVWMGPHGMKEVLTLLRQDGYFNRLSSKKRLGDVVFVAVKDGIDIEITRTCPDRSELMNGHDTIVLFNLARIEKCVAHAIERMRSD